MFDLPDGSRIGSLLSLGDFCGSAWRRARQLARGSSARRLALLGYDTTLQRAIGHINAIGRYEVYGFLLELDC